MAPSGARDATSDAEFLTIVRLTRLSAICAPGLSAGSSRNMRSRRIEVQAGVCLANAESRVDANDICEVSQGFAAKVAQPSIIGPELGLETFPGDQRGSS